MNTFNESMPKKSWKIVWRPKKANWNFCWLSIFFCIKLWKVSRIVWIFYRNVYVYNKSQLNLSYGGLKFFYKLLPKVLCSKFNISDNTKKLWRIFKSGFSWIVNREKYREKWESRIWTQIKWAEMISEDAFLYFSIRICTNRKD